MLTVILCTSCGKIDFVIYDDSFAEYACIRCKVVGVQVLVGYVKIEPEAS